MSAIDHEVRALPGETPEGLRAVGEPSPPGEVRLRVEPDDLPGAMTSLRQAGARFITMTVAAEPEPSVLLILAHRGAVVVLRTLELHANLSQGWPAVERAERELFEEHGIGIVTGGRRLTAPDADALDRRVEGLDAFTIPYGPVRSGIFEAIQFQIETGGESVVSLQTRSFFKRRGMEARFRGMTIYEGVHVAERVAAVASVAYALAYSHAVERAIGIEVPRAAERWRAFHAELERIANHLDVIAKEAETTALYVGLARFQILKERVQRLRAHLCGSRFGRGVIVPGGVRLGPRVDHRALQAELDVLERDFRRDHKLFIATASMTDRLIGSGHLSHELVDAYGAVGPLARGSGVATDARHERPYGAYRRSGLEIMTRREGDAMARINVRFDEIGESLRVLRQSLEHLVELPDERSLPARGSGAACGWAEAPQGELVVWVEVDEERVANIHLASPSLRNWAMFDQAFPSDVLTDFAFIEHSFGLTPAGADR